MHGHPEGVGRVPLPPQGEWRIAPPRGRQGRGLAGSVTAMRHIENPPRARLVAVLAAAAGIALLTAACGSSPAAGGSSPAAPGGSSSSGSQLVAFARCMRAHGVTDYPDSGSVTGATPGSDLDPGNPTYQAARQACQSLHPTQHLSQSQAAQNLAAGLAFSKCMRQHGITNYPDPGPHSGLNGGYGINLSGVDMNSPQFRAAKQACQQYQNPNSKG